MSPTRRHPLACVLLAFAAIAPAAAQDPNLGAMTFFPLAPCRILDTRPGSGVQGAGEGPLAPGVSYSFDVSGGSATCGVPAEARGAVLNFVAVAPGGPGHLTVWPWDSPASAAPNASILNFDAGRTVANGVAVRICHLGSATSTCSEDLFAVLGVSSAHLVVDVLGYHAPPGYGPLWGEGRGGSAYWGTCVRGDYAFGLSIAAVPWADAAAACPAGTWVCTGGQRGAGPCDTDRFDSDCDQRDCNNVCEDRSPGNHTGWVDDHGSAFSMYWTSETGTQGGSSGCWFRPVWCCWAL